MTLTPRRLKILECLRRYFVLRTSQIRDRLNRKDKDGSITRSELRRLCGSGLARRYEPKFIDPFIGSAPPVSTITVKGASVLATAKEDMSLLLKAEVSFSNWISVNHWAALSPLAMLIDDAFAGQNYAKLVSMHFEHEVIDPAAKNPSERFFLHTTVGEKCFFIPDLALQTEVKGYVRVLFGEYQTGADSPARVAAKKHRGIEAFAAGKHLKAMFPNAEDFRVIFFLPNAAFRDAVRKEFNDKKVREWVLFCSTLDVTAEKLLHEPILYTVDKGPFPLIPKPAGASGGGKAGGEGAGEALIVKAGALQQLATGPRLAP